MRLVQRLPVPPGAAPGIRRESQGFAAAPVAPRERRSAEVLAEPCAFAHFTAAFSRVAGGAGIVRTVRPPEGRSPARPVSGALFGQALISRRRGTRVQRRICSAGASCCVGVPGDVLDVGFRQPTNPGGSPRAASPFRRPPHWISCLRWAGTLPGRRGAPGSFKERRRDPSEQQGQSRPHSLKGFAAGVKGGGGGACLPGN